MLNLIKRGSYNFNNIRENTIDFDIIMAPSIELYNEKVNAYVGLLTVL